MHMVDFGNLHVEIHAERGGGIAYRACQDCNSEAHIAIVDDRYFGGSGIQTGQLLLAQSADPANEGPAVRSHCLYHLHGAIGKAEIDDDIGLANQPGKVTTTAPESCQLEILVRLETSGNCLAHASVAGYGNPNHEPRLSKKRLTVPNQLSARGLCLSPPEWTDASNFSSSSFCSAVRFTGVSTATSANRSP